MDFIIRNTNKNYTSINNAYAQDKRLKYSTIGILTVILTNKSDWVVYPEEVAKRLGISRRTVDEHFKILEKTGYLRIYRKSFGRGKGVAVHRFFSDMPITDEYFAYLKDKLEKELSTGKEN